MLSQFPETLTVCDRIVMGQPITGPIDVVLYDTYGRIGLAGDALRELVEEPAVGHVAVFSLWFPEELISEATAIGVEGFVSKALPATAIRDAVVAVASGRRVHAIEARDEGVPDELDWPGRAEGVSERESQVLVLAAEGMTNPEIAAALFVSVDTVKTHFSQVLSKLHLRNRVQAAAYVARSGAFSRYQPVENADSPGGFPTPEHGTEGDG
jgi:DNA-binding NarL/FixJ family response regulator